MEISVEELQVQSKEISTKIWDANKLCQQKVAAAKTGASSETIQAALDRSEKADKFSGQYNKCFWQQQTPCEKKCDNNKGDGDDAYQRASACKRVCSYNSNLQCMNYVDKIEATCKGENPEATAAAETPSCGKAFIDKLTQQNSAKPSCSQLYRVDEKVGCAFTGATGIPFSSDDALELQDKVDKLKANQGAVLQGKFKDGKDYALGVLKKPDGSYTFTSNGITYHDTPKEVLAPGLGTKLGDGWTGAKKSFLGFFGVGKYVGKGTAGDKTAQSEGQMRFEAASVAFDSLQQVSRDPEKQLAMGQEVVDRWQGGSDNLIAGEYQDVILDELKATTGCDLPVLKKILSGEIVDAVIDKGALTRQLYTFPAQSVITLAKETRKASFADAARIYMEERAGGKSQDKIAELLGDGKLPELDVATSIKGVGREFARGALFNSYEEAYQRYLLAKQLKN